MSQFNTTFRMALVVTVVLAIAGSAIPAVAGPPGSSGPAPMARSAGSEAMRAPQLPAAVGAAPRFTNQPALVKSQLRFSLAVSAWRKAKQHKWAKWDRISGTVTIARPGQVAVTLATPAQVRSGAMWQGKVKARQVRKDGKLSLRVALPKKVAKSLRGITPQQFAQRVMVTVWHDKDARKSVKGRDFRQTAFSNLGDSSTGVFDPDEGDTGYTEAEAIALNQNVDNQSPFDITVYSKPNQCALGAGPGVHSGTPNAYVIPAGTTAQVDGLAPKRIGTPSDNAGLFGSQVLQLGLAAAQTAVQAAAAAVASAPAGLSASSSPATTGSGSSDPGPTSTSWESQAKALGTKATKGLVSGGESAAGPLLFGIFKDLIGDSCAATGNKNPALWTLNVTASAPGAGTAINYRTVNWQYQHNAANPYNPTTFTMPATVANGLTGLSTTLVYEWDDPGTDDATSTRSKDGASGASGDNLITLSGGKGSSVFDAGLTVISDWKYSSDSDKDCYFGYYLPGAFTSGCHGTITYYVGYDATPSAVSGPVRQGNANLLTTRTADGGALLDCVSPKWQMNLPWHLSMAGGTSTAGGAATGPGLGDAYSLSEPPSSVPGAQGALVASFWYSTAAVTAQPFTNVPGFVVQATQGSTLSDGVSQYIPAASLQAAAAGGPITQIGCSLKAFGAQPNMAVPGDTVNMGLVYANQGQAVGWWSAPTAAVARMAHPTQGTISADPPVALADGADPVAITVTLQDATGASLAASNGDIVRIRSNLGQVSAVTDNADGSFTAVLTSGTAGTATVSATLNGMPMANSTTVGFNAAQGGLGDDRSLVTISSDRLVTIDGINSLVPNYADNAQATVTVTARDKLGRRITHGGSLVVIHVSGDVAYDIPDSEVTDNRDGTYTATLKAQPGVIQPLRAIIRAEVDEAMTSSTQILTYPGPPDPTTTTMQLVAAGGSEQTDQGFIVHTYGSFKTLMQLVDSQGNPTALVSPNSQAIDFRAYPGMVAFGGMQVGNGLGLYTGNYTDVSGPQGLVTHCNYAPNQPSPLGSSDFACASYYLQ